MKAFFNRIRPLFHNGTLSEKQVAGMTRLIQHGRDHGYKRSHIAAALATSFHETGQRMQPVREGFCQTDRGSREAVALLHKKGIIRRNYALPNAAGQSFYGRGDVQITHEENYAKFAKLLNLPLVVQPDLVLHPRISAAILFIGMRDGMFRHGRSFDMLPDNPTFSEYREARDIINGDVRKNGDRIAEYCQAFYKALDKLKSEPIVPSPYLYNLEPAPKESVSKWNILLRLLKWLLVKFGG